MTTTTAAILSPVVGWRVGTNWDENFYPTNQEVCDTFGVELPSFLDEDGTDLFDCSKTYLGTNDRFSAFCYAVSNSSGYGPDRTFANLNDAAFYASGVEDAVIDFVGDEDAARFVYWDITQDASAWAKEMFLDALGQTEQEANVA